MAIRLYMDVHVPAAVTESLRRRGVDVLTSQSDGTRTLDDARLLRRATQLGRVLVTQDADLLHLTARWQNEGTPFAGVIYSHPQRMTIGRMIDEVELVATCCTEQEVVNRVIWLPLK